MSATPRSGEEGQILPILMLAMALVIIVGFLLSQVGSAARLKTEGQTSADAAALAGEKNVKDQLLRAITSGEGATPETIDWLEVESAARDYAKRNDGTLTSFQHLLFDVRVVVRSDRGLDGESVGRDDARAVSRARAAISSTYAIGAGLGAPAVGGAPAPGGGSACGSNPIPPGELKDIEDKAGVKLRGDSALKRYACRGDGDGPNVAQLAEAMKVAIAKAEDLMGAPIVLNSAYRSAAYQAALCARTSGRCAPPGQSMHNFGLAIDVGNYTQLAQVAEKAGMCQPFPAPGDDNVHFSPLNGPECGGKGGPLGSGQAFGGSPLSFVTYDVLLVKDDGVGVGGL